MNARVKIASIIVPSTLIVILMTTIEWSHKAAAQPVASPDSTCSSSSPCLEEDNLGSGVGIKGLGINAAGVTGTTQFNSTSPPGKSGVFGNDASTSGTFNYGVLGNSRRGTGVLGQSTRGNGVVGTTSVSDGLRRATDGVFGEDLSTQSFENENSGVEGLSTYGSGVVGFSRFGLGVSAGSGAGPAFEASSDGNNINSNGITAFGGQEYSLCASVPDCAASIDARFTGFDGGQQNLITGHDIFGNLVFYADSFGNLTLTGQLVTSGSCSIGCISTRSVRKRVLEYAPRSTEPTIEDAGEAHLINGQLFVRLDPVFANVIDGRRNYLAFVTAEGENSGLYVTGKSPAGFWVRESHNGRDSLMFEYRILARPFRASGNRLPQITLRSNTALSGELAALKQRHHP